MRKHFLLLMLMALLPMAGFALTLDVSKLQAANIGYGTATLPDVTSTTYTKGTDYEVVTDKYYTDAEGNGETPVANLATAAAGVKYYIKVNGKGDYDLQTVYVDFWVNPVAVTIAFSDGLGKTFGATDAETITYTLKKEGSAWDVDEGTEALGLTVSRAEGDTRGTYALSFDWTNKNYNLTRTDDYVYTISPKAITPTITIGSEVLTYDGSALVPTITVKDGTTTLDANQYTLTYAYSADNSTYGSYGAAHTNAGYYKVTVTAEAAGNYSWSPVEDNGPFQIKKAPLTVYVNDLEKEYDGTVTIPTTVTFAYSGLKGADAEAAKPFGADAFTADYVTTEATNKNVGSHALKPVVNSPTDAYNNYDATLLGTGNLIVTAKAITVKPTDGQNKSFGDDDPVFTVDASAAISADQLTVASAYTVTRTDASNNTVGTHEGVLTLTKNTGLSADVETVLANYDITLAANNFVINAAALYVYPKSVTITYGEATPEFTVVATNEKGNAVELTSTPTVKVKGYDTAPTAKGTYVLELEGTAAADGYETINKLDGQFTISAKALTITLGAQALHVGDKANALNAEKVTFNGLVGDDKIGYTLDFNTTTSSEEGLIPSGDMSGDALNATNTYTKGIKISEDTSVDGNANANYDIDWSATGKLTVGAATEIVFLSDDDDWAEIVKFDDQTASSVKWTVREAQPIASYTGDWKAEEWNTIILPFETSARKLSVAFGYAIVNVVNPSATQLNNVKFKLQMTGTIAANTPIAIKTDVDIPAGTEIDFGNIDGKKIVMPADKKVEIEAGLGHKFVGVYETMTIDKTTPNYHFLVNGGWKHITSTSANKYDIVPFNCYLDQSNAASAPDFTITFQELDGSFTAIKAVDANITDNNGAVKNTGWYNINGMKLDAAPTKKGLYILNGKKYVVK